MLDPDAEVRTLMQMLMNLLPRFLLDGAFLYYLLVMSIMYWAETIDI